MSTGVGPVGMIGLGNMGSAMAANLVKAGLMSSGRISSSSIASTSSLRVEVRPPTPARWEGDVAVSSCRFRRTPRCRPSAPILP